MTIANLLSRCRGKFSYERVVLGSLQRSTIDYCLVSSPQLLSSLRIVSSARHRSGSDHKPILASLNLPLRTGSPSIPLRQHNPPWSIPNHDDPRWVAYKDLLDPHLNWWCSTFKWPTDGSAPPIACHHTINLAAASLVTLIAAAAASSFPPAITPSSHGLGSKPTMSPAILASVIARNIALATAQSSGSHSDFEAYRKAARETRSLIRARKRHLRALRFQKLEQLEAAGRGKDFWSLIKRLSSPDSSLPDSFLKFDGTLCSQAERAETVGDFFNSLGSIPPPSTSFPPPSLSLYTALDHASASLLDDANAVITPGEIRVALGRLKSGSSPGPDGVHGELFKRAGPTFALCFSTLMMACWNHSVWPSQWSLGTISLIHKSLPIWITIGPSRCLTRCRRQQSMSCSPD